MGHEDKDIVRLHHDCDKSFEGDLTQYLIDENIEDTNTGGYETNTSQLRYRLPLLMAGY